MKEKCCIQMLCWDYHYTFCLVGVNSMFLFYIIQITDILSGEIIDQHFVPHEIRIFLYLAILFIIPFQYAAGALQNLKFEALVLHSLLLSKILSFIQAKRKVRKFVRMKNLTWLGFKLRTSWALRGDDNRYTTPLPG